MPTERSQAINAAFAEIGFEPQTSPVGSDWRRADELAEDEAAIDEMIRHGLDNLGAKRRDVAGQQLVEAWAWPVAAVAGAAILSGEALPDLSGANVLIRGGAPGVIEVALREPSATDEEEHGEAAALLARTLAEDHFGPLIGRVSALTQRPREGLWRGVGDRLAGAILWLGEVVGDPAEGERAAAAALAADTPFRGALEIDRIDVGGRVEALHVRNGCCIWYRSDDPTKCASCPLLSEAHRRAKIES